jgi:uncharacterized RDD family membrane protein YckC
MKQVGIGTRALNFLVDTIIISVLAYAAFKTWNWYVMYWHYPFYNFGWFFFGILFVYYTLFELIAGRTPGKWMSFSKVIDRNGKRASAIQVFIRSIIRLTIIDMFFIPFLDKPLHDYLSKTEVVEV